MRIGRAINHKITVEPSHNHGFVVKIGCGTLVFADSDSMLIFAKDYLANPEKWEKEYNNLASPELEVPTESQPDSPDISALDNLDRG